MTTKKAPATALPWRTGRDVGVMAGIDAEFDGVVWHVALAHHNAMYGVDASASAEQNAAYIAHACNAYPLLVEALRRFAGRSDEDVNYFGRADEADHLLRSLGESE